MNVNNSNQYQCICKKQTKKNNMKKGYIDKVKYPSNTWLLVMNPHSMRLDNNKKIEILIEAYKTKQIDRFIMSEVNIK